MPGARAALGTPRLGALGVGPLLLGVPLLGVVLGATARAGPPLATEDPGIVPAGVLEVILAATVERTSPRTDYAIPLLDATYGVADRLELALTLPWIEADPEGGGGRSGLGVLGVAVKWRAAGPADGPWALSLAPGVEIPVSSSAGDRGVSPEATVVRLPVVAEVREGPWRLGGQLAGEIHAGERDRWRHGLYAGRELLGGRVELLAEVRWSARLDASRDVPAWRAGAVLEGPLDTRILAAAGRSFAADAPDRASLELFVGILVPLSW